MITALALALSLSQSQPPGPAPLPTRPPTAATPAQEAPPAGPAPIPEALPAGALRDWYPAPEPFREGWLEVSKLHTLHYELSGNPQGHPAMVLHGGPGGGASPSLRRYFDPEKWLIVLHDQRGAGRSKPFAELRENDTAALVEDVEKLRAALGLEKMLVVGGSWGSTLALAYAEKYPQRVAGLVLRGVFTCTRGEIDHFYHGGTAPFFPETHAALRAVIPHPERNDWPRQLLRLMTSGDAAVRDRAVHAWALYETRMSRVGLTQAEAEQQLQGYDALAFSTIENHYMASGCFLREGQLLRDASRLAGIPLIMVQGRYDVICPPISAWRVQQAVPGARLWLVEDAGHSGGAEPVRRGLVEAVRQMEAVVAAPR
ncbi:MAG: prolyl aminopeptidase [Anaeromyxobacter sp.]